MSTSNTEGNPNRPGLESTQLSAISLIRRHAKKRPTENDIDKVMARLAGEGPENVSSHEGVRLAVSGQQKDGDCLVSEDKAALLDAVYDRYQQRRIDTNSAQVNVVMQRLQEIASEFSSTENQIAQSIQSPAPGLPKTLFNLPHKIVCKASHVIKAALFGGSKAMVPVLALAVTAIAVVPFIIQNSNDQGLDAGSERFAFEVPQSLSNSPLAVQNINTDPGLVTAMGANSDVVDQVVSLGQRLTEIEILLAAESTQATAPLLASRLNSISSQLGDEALATAVSSMSALVNQPDVDVSQIKSEIAELRVRLSESSNPRLVDATKWLVFGEAVETLSIAERIERSDDPLALKPSLVMAESLSRFNAMNFAESLPALSDLSIQAIKGLAQAGDSDLDTANKREEVRTLLQQLRLSI